MHRKRPPKPIKRRLPLSDLDSLAATADQGQLQRRAALAPAAPGSSIDLADLAPNLDCVESLRRTITPETWDRINTSLAERATRGCVKSAQLIYERAHGKPRLEPDRRRVSIPGLPELMDLHSCADAAALIAQLLASGSISIEDAGAASAAVQAAREAFSARDLEQQVVAMNALLASLGGRTVVDQNDQTGWITE